MDTKTNNMLKKCLIITQKILFSSYCLLCKHQAPPPAYFCKSCISDFSSAKVYCKSCGIDLVTAYSEHQPCCGNCLKKPPPFDRTLPCFDYCGSIKQMIGRMKYHNQFMLTKALGQLMVSRVDEYYQEHSQLAMPQAIIPVPMHRKRLFKRGFNQACELAKPLAKALSVPLHPGICRRLKHTPPLSQLKRTDRKSVMRNAIKCKATGIKRVAIVDDIMTTGTTAWHLSLALKKQGVEEIHIWTLARANPMR